MSERYAARTWRHHVLDVSVKADTFWLELGHLRALVAATEGAADDAPVTFEGLSKSYSRVDEYTAKSVTVRDQTTAPSTRGASA